MDHPVNVIQLRDLWANRKAVDATGATIHVNLGLALASVRHDIAGMWSKRVGDMDTFHVQERMLYDSIFDCLRNVLPIQAVIDIEAVLKRLPAGNNAKKTDISIRRLSEVNAPRLDDHHHACFVEVKSVFHDENLAISSIHEDLEKLLLCETAYDAKCFFMLVGLEKDLTRVAPQTSVLGLHNSVGPIQVLLPSKKTAWLQPSARWVDANPHVYVWLVSNHNVFGADASNFTYSVFQGK